MRFLVAAAALVSATVLASVALGGGLTTIKLGDAFTVNGQTSSAPGTRVRATGSFVASARRGAGAWYLVKKGRTDAQGHFTATIRPSLRGTYTFRLLTPDKRVITFLLRVT
jgi:hypothetical protein